MKKDYLVLDFLRFPVLQRIEIGRIWVNSMKDVAAFETVKVYVAEIEEKTDILEKRNVAASGGGKEDTMLLHQAMDDWNTSARILAMHVELLANGNGAILLAAGYALGKTPTRSPMVELQVKLGQKSGSVLLRRIAVQGARAYIWQYCIGESPAEEGGWITADSTAQATVEINGLTALTKYWFRVAVISRDGTSEFCTPVMQIVI